VIRDLKPGDYPAAVVDSPSQTPPLPETAVEKALTEPEPVTGEVEAAAPPVVVVMVTYNPGPWFEESLASVTAQGYANASLLVIDAGSDADLELRIAAVASDAHLRRLPENVGFGPAANEVLRAVEGAAFYLFCHDDIRLDPDVVQVMVEEAYRSNAGIVGGKIVEWDDPARILQVGMGVDKTGAPAPIVERGELDQEQHDAVRDVFYVPGAATLVRADLFEALGGFDPGIELLGEDLDLSWRAHVVGARVLVAPGARIAHLEALGERRPIDDRRRLQMRHRLRTSRICYSFGSRLRVMPQGFIVAVIEMIHSVVVGRFRQAADVLSAWWWNLRRHGEIRSRRKALKAKRAVPDREIRPLQVRGSARLSGFLRGQLGSGDDRIGSVAGAGRELVTNLRSTSARSSVVAWLVVAVVLAFGSRQLITDGIPAVGQFAAFPDHPSTLVHQWLSGFRNVGLGSESPAPTLQGVLGALGYLFFGAMGLLRTVVMVGALPLGALGMWRLARPIGSRRARIVALLVYVCIPVGYNAIAEGRWTGLVMYGFAPWMLNQLAKGSGLAPFGPIGDPPGPGASDRPLLQRVVLLGLVTALAALVTPVAIVMVPVVAVVLVVGGLVVGEVRGAGRILAIGFAGAATALVLQLPWSVSLVTGGWQALVGATSLGGNPLTAGAIVRFETGPFGAAPLGWLFLPAGLLALVIGRRWRLGWAARSWALVLASFAATLVLAGGAFSGWFPAPEVLLAPAAVGLALAAGLGMTAFEADLPDYRFGWRQVASVLAALTLMIGVLPVLAAAGGGRWGLPESDFARPLRNVESKQGNGQIFRVLWLGDANLLPVAGWVLDAPPVSDLGAGALLAYATSEDGMGDVSGMPAGTDAGATKQLADVMRIAAAGGTSRLGALLAPMGIRYVVVPTGNAPRPFATGTEVNPTSLLTVLDAQLDLSNVEVARGVVVYRNAAFGPERATLPPGTAFPSGGPGVADRIVPALTGAATALPDQRGYQSFAGSVPDPATVYLGAASSSRWQLRVDGQPAERQEVLGWANAFTAAAGSNATLVYQTAWWRLPLLGGQAFLWGLVLVYLFRSRVRIERVRDLDELANDGAMA